jgi:hypothetical protein
MTTKQKNDAKAREAVETLLREADSVISSAKKIEKAKKTLARVSTEKGVQSEKAPR